MQQSFQSLAALLFAACLIASSNAAPGPLINNMVKAFAETHSANGSAVGTLSWSNKGTNSEKKIGKQHCDYCL